MKNITRDREGAAEGWTPGPGGGLQWGLRDTLDNPGDLWHISLGTKEGLNAHGNIHGLGPVSTASVGTVFRADGWYGAG